MTFDSNAIQQYFLYFFFPAMSHQRQIKRPRPRSQGSSCAHSEEYAQQPLEPPQQFPGFNSQLFKTEPCRNQHPQNQRKLCPYFHDDSDRRRDPNKYSYKCILCQNAENCQKGDECDYAHNKVEQVYHPNRYKTKFCTSEEQCEYGQYCSFAHSEEELKLPMMLHTMPKDLQFWMYHYKTVWCPFIRRHDRAVCVYAHNPQDFRRDPALVKPIECPSWCKQKQVQNYEEGGCKDMQVCQLCHGWKEYEYHPQIYKTKPCTAPNCQKNQSECAYYHNEQDRRQVDIPPKARGQISEGEGNDMRRKPFKANSNYNVPIIPNYLPGNDLLPKKKLEIGQPLELFSQLTYKSNANTKETDSRKNSIESYGKQTRGEIQQKQHTQTKKHRTAPVTPNQKDNVPMCQQQQPHWTGMKYSKKFTELMLRKPAGYTIIQVLSGLKLTENNLMQMGEQQLAQNTKLLQHEFNYLVSVLQDLKIDQNEDELLWQATNQDN